MGAESISSSQTNVQSNPSLWYTSSNSLLSNNNIWYMSRDHQNQIWIGTYGGGLNVYDPVKKEFSVYLKSDDHTSVNSNDIRLYILKTKSQESGSQHGEKVSTFMTEILIPSNICTISQLQIRSAIIMFGPFLKISSATYGLVHGVEGWMSWIQRVIFQISMQLLTRQNRSAIITSTALYMTRRKM